MVVGYEYKGRQNMIHILFLMGSVNNVILRENVGMSSEKGDVYLLSGSTRFCKLLE